MSLSHPPGHLDQMDQVDQESAVSSMRSKWSNRSSRKQEKLSHQRWPRYAPGLETMRTKSASE